MFIDYFNTYVMMTRNANNNDERSNDQNIKLMPKHVIYNVLHMFNWREFVCGWGAAFSNITLTYPIYKVIFRQMLHNIDIKTSIEQIKDEGIRYLYRGMFPPLAQKTISLSVMFGVYDATRRLLLDKFNFNPYSAKSISGFTAGSFEAILMPFERVQTLLADAKYHKHFQNTTQAFIYCTKHHGVLELYRGFIPIILRNGPANALFFVIREEAHMRLPQRESAFGASCQNFLSGAFIGALLSSVFYPINVVKISMQSVLGGKSPGVFEVLKTIYIQRDRKISNVYRGVLFNCTRSFMSWGIINLSYETIKKYVYKI